MKRGGLERNRWIEPIDDFVRQFGQATPRWALICTYEIDLDRLARSVLPVLSRRGRRFRTVVLADAERLEKALGLLNRHELPGAVNLHPIRLRRGGVFHAKLVMLRAGRHLRACFGSANLTDGGLGTNLELWTHSDAPEIIGGLAHFVTSLANCDHAVMDPPARRSIARALCGVSTVRSPAVWSSIDESFAHRLHGSPDGKAEHASIISPLYASEGGLKAARSGIPVKTVALYTDLAVAVNGGTAYRYEPPHPATQEGDDPETFQRTLHAKGFVFHGCAGAAASAWVGSANFTAQAMTKRVAKGGNVELLVRTELPDDEVRALDQDLRHLFKKVTGSARIEPPPTSAPERPKATIVACELIGDTAASRLVVHSTQQAGHVVLECEGRRARIAIKKGRGVLEGPPLRKLLGPLDLSVARALMLYQRVGVILVPIVVNVPHVPPEDEPGVDPHASLDALLDDLMGRIRLPPLPDEAGIDDGEDSQHANDTFSSTETDPADNDMKEYGKRLDEARHQGELDQLAVKAALLRKLIRRAAAVGLDGDGMFDYALAALLNACPVHLRRAVRAAFAGDTTGKPR